MDRFAKYAFRFGILLMVGAPFALRRREFLNVRFANADGVEANLQSREITTDSNWRHEGKVNNMYEVEQDELFAGIRTGQPLNNGEYMANSTLLAIMGRMATYTGQEVTWDQALNSQQDLSPKTYAWGDAPEVEIAMPGITKLL